MPFIAYYTYEERSHTQAMTNQNYTSPFCKHIDATSLNIGLADRVLPLCPPPA